MHVCEDTPHNYILLHFLPDVVSLAILTGLPNDSYLSLESIQTHRLFSNSTPGGIHNLLNLSDLQIYHIISQKTNPESTSIQRFQANLICSLEAPSSLANLLLQTSPRYDPAAEKRAAHCHRNSRYSSELEPANEFGTATAPLARYVNSWKRL